MKIGELTFQQPLLLAPMDDITDQPFRLICKELGADIVYTEFTSCEALIRSIPKALERIRISDAERPIGIQLFGSKPESCERAVGVCECLRPDFIDFNCGCPMKKHVARGEGAALLKDSKKLELMARTIVQATALPVTIKTRLGWDQNSIDIVEIAQRVEQAGVAALVVHCRTRSQAYRGQADWSWLEKIRKVISIPLVGNGDVTRPQDVKTLLDMGCDGVMIGRGAVQNPWIFQQARHFLATGEIAPPPALKVKIDLCLKHLAAMIKLKGERNGILPFRKHYCGYLKGVRHVSQLRADLMRLTTFDDIQKRLYVFLEENQDCSARTSL